MNKHKYVLFFSLFILCNLLYAENDFTPGDGMPDEKFIIEKIEEELGFNLMRKKGDAEKKSNPELNSATGDLLKKENKILIRLTRNSQECELQVTGKEELIKLDKHNNFKIDEIVEITFSKKKLLSVIFKENEYYGIYTYHTDKIKLKDKEIFTQNFLIYEWFTPVLFNKDCHYPFLFSEKIDPNSLINIENYTISDIQPLSFKFLRPNLNSTEVSGKQ